MRRFIFAILVATLLAIPSAIVAPVSAADCQFVLGFKLIHDMIPDQVGKCLIDEHHNPTNGDGLQETTGPTGAGGLLVWRKSDNWTAYTDGYRSWVNGPNGLQMRLNTERFTWENDGQARPVTVAPTPTASKVPLVDIVFYPDTYNTFRWDGGVLRWDDGRTQVIVSGSRTMSEGQEYGYAQLGNSTLQWSTGLSEASGSGRVLVVQTTKGTPGVDKVFIITSRGQTFWGVTLP